MRDKAWNKAKRKKRVEKIRGGAERGKKTQKMAFASLQLMGVSQP